MILNEILLLILMMAESKEKEKKIHLNINLLFILMTWALFLAVMQFEILRLNKNDDIST